MYIHYGYMVGWVGGRSNLNSEFDNGWKILFKFTLGIYDVMYHKRGLKISPEYKHVTFHSPRSAMSPFFLKENDTSQYFPQFSANMF